MQPKPTIPSGNRSRFEGMPTVDVYAAGFEWPWDFHGFFPVLSPSVLTAQLAPAEAARCQSRRAEAEAALATRQMAAEHILHPGTALPDPYFPVGVLTPGETLLRNQYLSSQPSFPKKTTKRGRARKEKPKEKRVREGSLLLLPLPSFHLLF